MLQNLLNPALKEDKGSVALRKVSNPKKQTTRAKSNFLLYALALTLTPTLS